MAKKGMICKPVSLKYMYSIPEIYLYLISIFLAITSTENLISDIENMGNEQDLLSISVEYTH